MSGITSTSPALEPAAHRVIRASAGAGKTRMLSDRYLHLLYRGASPTTILATTFTRKAAGEILRRVIVRLAHAAGDEKAASHLSAELQVPGMSLDDVRRMLQQLLGSLHRVSVSTIDSFFNRMVQCFRFELGVPGQPRIVAESDPQAMQLRRAAIDAMLADDDPQVLLDLLRRLHHDEAQRRVTDAIDDIVAQLYDVYRQTDEQAWSVLRPPKGTLDEAALADALNELRAAGDELPAGQQWAKAWSGDLQHATARNWLNFIERGLAGKIAQGQTTYYRKAIPEQVTAAYLPLIDHARGELVGRSARRTGAMFELLHRFDEHYTKLRRDDRLLLFSDLAQKLARDLPALGDDLMLDIYYRLDTTVSHLLLDEFQDTSIEQWAVLRPFAEEIRAHSGGEAGDRTFFCVGDVKQAIYGWRGGCAEIFAQVEHDLQLPTEARQALDKSYRCAPVVLDTVNRIFASIADSPPLAEHQQAARQWQANFTGQQAHYQDQPGYVELMTSTAAPVDDSDQADTDAPPAHFVYVADKVAQLAQQTPGRSIAVLVRTNKTVRQLIYLLRQRRLHASGEGGTPVTDDPAVNTILSALTLADHPGHTAAAYHVLNSPLAQIIDLASALEHEVAVAARRIRRAIAAEGYAAIIARWAKLLAPSCHRRSISRLTQLVELADRYRPTTTIRTIDFVQFVQATDVQEPSPSPVRVMTIHRSKGLEFDAVILPELESLIGRGDNQPVWAYRPSPTDPPSAVFATVNRAQRALLASYCPLVDEAHAQDRSRRLHDDLSALYVAMTRARFALHLIVEPLRRNKDGKPGARGFSNASYAAVLRHALSDREEDFAGGQVLYQLGDPNWHEQAQPAACQPDSELPLKPLQLKLRAAGDRPTRNWSRLRPSAAEDRPQVRAADLLRIDQYQLRGRIVHSFFQCVQWLDDEADRPRDEQLTQAARRTAPGQSEDRIAQLIGDFKNALAHPQVRKALTRPDGNVDLWRERPFAALVDDALIQGIFDRVVIHRSRGEPARATVLDFKTDQAPVQRYDTLVETYRPQLAAYKTALCTILNLPQSEVEAHLLFTEEGILAKL